MLVAASLAVGLQTYRALVVDLNKQRALVDLFAHDPAIARASLVLHEWNGLLEDAFGDQTRFAVDPKDARLYAAGSLDSMMTHAYKAAQHQRHAGAPAVQVDIREVPGSASGSGIWRGPLNPRLTISTSTLSALPEPAAEPK